MASRGEETRWQNRQQRARLLDCNRRDAPTDGARAGVTMQSLRLSARNGEVVAMIRLHACILISQSVSDFEDQVEGRTGLEVDRWGSACR